MGMIKEFKEFAIKGNMVDMAVGIIIGGAFGLIVKSLISDVIMPIVGKVVGDIDFSNMYMSLSSKVTEKMEAAAATGDVLTLDEAREFGPVLAYGNFISIFINFLILAFVIFIMVKMINNAKKKFEKEQEAAPPKAPAEEVVLLRDIRDALQKNG